ncbi:MULTISPECIES: hypothetical protein [unclassified Rhizobium]|uniref:hypothetical protein n=1 Tax=unclassified Rhizobium TaxID=2613769 RepID=UPI00167BEB0D|nr:MULTISPECIES: hypothetical protein [unclassified Rhizobium]
MIQRTWIRKASPEGDVPQGRTPEAAARPLQNEEWEDALGGRQRLCNIDFS